MCGLVCAMWLMCVCVVWFILCDLFDVRVWCYVCDVFDVFV